MLLQKLKKRRLRLVFRSWDDSDTHGFLLMDTFYSILLVARTWIPGLWECIGLMRNFPSMNLVLLFSQTNGRLRVYRFYLGDTPSVFTLMHVFLLYEVAMQKKDMQVR